MNLAHAVFGYNDDIQSARRAKIMVDRNNRMCKFFWRQPLAVIDSVISLIKKYENEIKAAQAGEVRL